MSTLERSYRRLLAWYPAEHRAAHEEEMLDVLLSTAKPGQARPSIAETFDLLRGAVRIRLRRAANGAGESVWPGALSIAGFLAMLMLVADGVRFAVNAPHLLSAVNKGLSEGDSRWYAYVNQFGTGPYWLAWAGVAFLAWRGSRRAAARAACAVTAAQLALIVYGFGFPDLWNASVGASLGGVPLPLAILASASLIASPGPRHGARSLGRRGVAGAVVVAAVLVTITSTPFMALILPDDPWPAWEFHSMDGAVIRWDRLLLGVVLVTALFLLVVLAPTRAGRRAAALLALAGTPLLAEAGLINMGVLLFRHLVLPFLVAESLIGFGLVMLVVRIVELPVKVIAKRREQASA
ncbi:hypothetical protein [Actinomadura roseirufa]|uniref:hypothetical protein n=1 Tax=Actinomadura roseirufa TaxID=2094049 RepID=UPI001041AF23|nr:hypothetical protein [Actinomadura roseirufa]